jgi:methyl-accepting chemotaxis protein
MVEITLEAEQEPCVLWLRNAARDRDLTRRLPALSDPAAAESLRRFVDGLRNEMLDFKEIVEAAAEGAALNAKQLREIVATTAEQSLVVERTASAIAEIDRGAAHVASTADALRTRSASLASSTGRYDEGVAGVIARLETLVKSIEAAASFAASMETGSAGIAGFLDRLRRIARQARLLAINAAIEAAHLGELGKGFVIVADEVKELSSSTADSAANVAQIEKQLRDASTQVEAAIRESSTIVRGISSELSVAQARSRATQSQVQELEGAIGSVAAIAAEQSASLSNIAEGVHHVSESAHGVAGAAERAAQLALGDAIARLQAAIAQYRLGERAANIALRGAQRDTDAAAVGEILALPEGLREAAAALRGRLDEDQREILGLVTGIAVSIARNSYEWRAIASGLASLRVELERIMHAIDETSAGAVNAGAASQQMRISLGELRAGFSTSIDELRRSLEHVAQVRETVRRAEGFVRGTSEAASRATAILELIDAIASETTLLSLNAAIEAAHAGTAGNGFGIIADEIRVLADTTSQATQQIATLIEELAKASASMTGTTADAVERTTEVHEETTQMQTTVGALREELDRTLDQATEVATIVDQQLAALRELREATQLARRRVESDTTASSDGSRLELAMLGMRAHALAARRPLGTLAEEIRAIGLAVGDEMDAVFEAAIARGAIRLEDCFDTAYVELTGSAIARLGRLFDVSKVPPEGFNPPKFETRYDRAVEDGLNALIDANVAKHRAIAAMFAVDLNGFCVGHYRECRHDWTGDYAIDNDRNRIKRFFEDDLSLRCSRVGLGAAANSIPKRAPYATFRERGCTVRREGERPWAIFTYARDTGVVYNDLSVALYARDQRVGTIRILYDADAI